MNRREFVAILSGTALASPLLARAQAMPVIGLLGTTSAGASENRLSSFRQGLQQTGFIEGQNVVIEYRWADGQRERLPVLAKQLLARPIALFAGISTSDPARTAMAITSTIPIVFAVGGDPVEAGLVSSVSRPGG